MPTTATNRLIEALGATESLGEGIFKAACPTHGDKALSIDADARDGRGALMCRQGCRDDAIAEALDAAGANRQADILRRWISDLTAPAYNPESRRADLRSHSLTEYTDAVVAEAVAEEWQQQWAFTGGLGWLRWTGQVWRQADDAEALEAVRQWVAAEVSRIAATGDPSRVRVAAGLLSKGRLANVAALVKGQEGILQRVEDFDADHDVLVCGNGVVDLRTGKLTNHDPSRLVTKMTTVDYHEDATHPDWTAALEAVPDDIQEWLCLRLGQAATGHVPDDDVMLLLHGGGANGKSTVLAAVSAALGAHCVTVPPRVLMDNSDHPTELMTLRGARLAVIEETPEAGRLNTQRLKMTVGTPTIRARLIRKDPVEFRTTHALVVATNHRPAVKEVDDGTWRRLALVTFPFRFVRHEPTGPGERRGDSRLRPRLVEGKEQQEAVLAWLVAGARAWYAEHDRQMPQPPERVEADTLAWRCRADLWLAYVIERLVPEPGRQVLGRDMTADHTQWSEQNGHAPWSDQTLSERARNHEWTRRHGITKGNLRVNAERLSRSHYRAAPGPVPGRGSVWTGVRFRSPEEEPVTGLERGGKGSLVTALRDSSRGESDNPFPPLSSLTAERGQA